ncbi:MAG: hypothetical protein L6R30_09925 [Thermoanaerobaculia bacterium]|nr:hypothetical protein [Thermoanaerobaculia bacterium]
MSRRPVSSSRGVLAGLLTLAFLSGPVLADASREYRKGLQSFKQENFAAAAASFRAAIAEDRKEGLQKIRGTGVSFDDYLPFFYLGLSLERTGQNKEALAALEESERQGALLERNDYRSRLQAALATLRIRAAELVPTHPPPPSPTAVPVVAAPTVRIAVATAAVPTAAVRTAAVPTAAVRTAAVASAGTSSRPPVPPVPTVERIVVGRPAPPATPVGPAASAEMGAVRFGAEQFFRNKFDAAIEVLRPHAGGSPVARLLLSFSIAGKALLAEKPDERELSEARQFYTSAKAEGARVDSQGFVSPRILELLDASSHPESPLR